MSCARKCCGSPDPWLGAPRCLRTATINREKDISPIKITVLFLRARAFYELREN